MTFLSMINSQNVPMTFGGKGICMKKPIFSAKKDESEYSETEDPESGESEVETDANEKPLGYYVKKVKNYISDNIIKEDDQAVTALAYQIIGMKNCKKRISEYSRLLILYKSLPKKSKPRVNKKSK